MMLSIIIPHFRRREDVSNLIDSLLNQNHPDFEIIIADDNSGDDSIDYLKGKYPDVIYTVNEINQGPSVARNRGIAISKGDIIVGIDSDVTVPDQNFLTKIEERFQNDKSLTGIGVRVLTSDGTSDDTPRWQHPVPIEKYADLAFETDYFSGTSYAFTKNAILEAGGFPEDFFQFYEEVELCYRIIDNGGTIKYFPDISVFHHPGSRPGRNKVRYYYNPRNQILLAARLFTPSKTITYLTPRLSYYFVKTLFTGNFGVFIKAMKDAKNLLPNRLNTRKPLSSITRKRLRELKKGVLCANPKTDTQ